MLIPKKEAVIQRQIEAVEETQKSIEVILSWNRYLSGTPLFDPSYKKAMQRGVFVRYVIQEPPTQELRQEASSTHTNALSQMRFIKNYPQSILAIYDKKKLMLLVDPTPNSDIPGESPSLWTNNQSLIRIVQEHFENLWKKAKKIEWF